MQKVQLCCRKQKCFRSSCVSSCLRRLGWDLWGALWAVPVTREQTESLQLPWVQGTAQSTRNFLPAFPMASSVQRAAVCHTVHSHCLLWDCHIQPSWGGKAHPWVIVKGKRISFSMSPCRKQTSELLRYREHKKYSLFIRVSYHWVLHETSIPDSFQRMEIITSCHLTPICL